MSWADVKDWLWVAAIASGWFAYEVTREVHPVACDHADPCGWAHYRLGRLTHRMRRR